MGQTVPYILLLLDCLSRVTVMPNLQTAGSQAKAYQVRQFLDMVEQYDLRLEDDS
jgi:hypothetical protein